MNWATEEKCQNDHDCKARNGLVQGSRWEKRAIYFISTYWILIKNIYACSQNQGEDKIRFKLSIFSGLFSHWGYDSRWWIWCHYLVLVLSEAPIFSFFLKIPPILFTSKNSISIFFKKFLRKLEYWNVYLLFQKVWRYVILCSS